MAVFRDLRRAAIARGQRPKPAPRWLRSWRSLAPWPRYVSFAVFMGLTVAGISALSIVVLSGFGHSETLPDQLVIIVPLWLAFTIAGIASDRERERMPWPDDGSDAAA